MRRKHIINTFARKAEKNWDTLYWAVDIHDTMIKANYKAGDIPTEFFPKAKEALQKIGSRSDCRLILFTCSHPHEIDKYLKYFEDHGIKFMHVNKNPEAENTAFGCFEHKFYTNFILDDKAGFDPKEDWAMILNALEYVEYMESTTVEERAANEKRVRQIPIFFGAVAMVSLILSCIIGVWSHWLIGTVLAVGSFIANTIYFSRKTESAPLKYHTPAFENEYKQQKIFNGFNI